MNWFIAVAVFVIIGFLLDREIYFYEGVHLGPRIQAWLYDRWSKQYDKGKQASQLRDNEMLAQPLNGSSSPVGARGVAEVLKCSACAQVRWMKTSDTLRCENCGKELSITSKRIVLN